MFKRNEKVYKLFQSAGALNLYVSGGKPKRDVVEQRLQQIKTMVDELIKSIDEIAK